MKTRVQDATTEDGIATGPVMVGARELRAHAEQVDEDADESTEARDHRLVLAIHQVPINSRPRRAGVRFRQAGAGQPPLTRHDHTRLGVFHGQDEHAVTFAA